MPMTQKYAEILPPPHMPHSIASLLSLLSMNIDLICVLALLRQIALLVILCVEHIESKGVRFARLEIAIGLQFAVNILRDISNEPLRSISEIARFGIMNVRLPAELFCISM